jgi:acyl-coenzyme A thioesterase PaaI-like protein
MSLFRKANLTKFRFWTAGRLQLVLNWWPPYALGPSIRVAEIASNFRHARVELPLRWYNQNYVGTHFGGSLYSMCDPMYMLLLLNILGPDFIVWDKKATIDYIKPGQGLVSAEFKVEDALVSSLLDMKAGERKDIVLSVNVTDTNGEVVASVVKTLYIRRKLQDAK